MESRKQGTVIMWEEEVVIPTYETGKPDKNPMFLENRVYQGSSGKVYPHSVIDKIYDEKINKKYQAIFLENDYLKIMILPELGGRVHRATDKTNNYDFVYYNHVIKPALVGLTGPWISGGIEFNWPQHHRPSTFDEVDYKLVENEDGSCTVWAGEIENMFRTKGMAGFTLYPDKAYLEINAKIYNRTNMPQTFLWWANPAVPANEHTQSIFPPDVHTVMDHGKRDSSNFPIATGTYYKMDYSEGVDISRYKNIPVPTSYMACHSDYDFVGGYDYQKEAGILHVANHHIAPGKKQWTWGCKEFGKAWDRNLTDEDGPYIELMTGCFTDNQPDFTWLMPYEEKNFTQYFMPYKGVGMIQNATKDAAAAIEIDGKAAVIKVYASAIYEGARVKVWSGKEGEKSFLDETITLSPLKAYQKNITIDAGVKETDVTILVQDANGKKLVFSKMKESGIQKTPDSAKEIPLPEEVKTTEELLLFGMHIEQYRHATYDPADYYREGLRRDKSDLRLNNAYGKLLFRQGLFLESRKYFRKSIEKMQYSNPNPYDGEPLYNMGCLLKIQEKYEKSYEYFYKATWNAAWQGPAFFQLACLACIQQDYESAHKHIEDSLVCNQHNMKARNLKTAILRKLGRRSEAETWACETLSIDCLDFNSQNELYFLYQEKGEKAEAHKIREILAKALHQNHNTYIELAIDYIEAAMYKEASSVLKLYTYQTDEKHVYPMIYYYIAFAASKMGEVWEAEKAIINAEQACSDYCFPHRLEDILVLEKAKELQPTLAMAYYYLGNLWYDKKQYDSAIINWEASKERNNDFSIVHRNLALAYYNKRNDKKRALSSLERANKLQPNDARVLMELDQLYKKTGKSVSERLEFLAQRLDVVFERDDLYLEYISLQNSIGNFEKAKELLEHRIFHPWEGGEGKVPAQYILSHVEMAKAFMERKDFQSAEKLLKNVTGEYPINFGEGKLAGAQENNIYYYLGIACRGLKQEEKATAYFEKASFGLAEPTGMMYYNDQPPEMIFYQGAALLQLGKRKEAFGKFNKLIDYGKKHVFDKMKIDYFAVSLPELQIFEEDLDKKNKVHCYFMIALGHLGKGESKEATDYFDKVLALDGTHVGAKLHAKWKDIDVNL